MSLENRRRQSLPARTTPISTAEGEHVPITADARDMQADLARFRHELHREPEIGLTLPRTQEKVLKALDGLPYEITLGKDTTSVTAVLRGGAAHASAEKPVVLLRAD